MTKSHAFEGIFPIKNTSMLDKGRREMIHLLYSLSYSNGGISCTNIYSSSEIFLYALTG